MSSCACWHIPIRMGFPKYIFRQAECDSCIWNERLNVIPSPIRIDLLSWYSDLRICLVETAVAQVDAVDSCCFLNFCSMIRAAQSMKTLNTMEQLTLHLSRHCGIVVSTQCTSDSVLFPLKVFLSYCLYFREAMSSQPPTYNIYFVAGNVSQEHFLRPSTPAGRPVLTPGAVNMSTPNPAPRRPPLPPGQLFTGSGQVVPPRPPVPSRAPGLLASAVARGRSRSSSRGTVSTASRVSVTRPESPPPGNWHNGGIWQPPQYSAAPHLPFSVWPLENQNSRAGVVENVSGKQKELRAWLRSRQDVQYPLEESFVKYLARILGQSAISPDQLTDLRLLEYDPQTHENYPEDVSPKRYYILRVFFAKVHTGSDSSGPGPFHTRSTAHSIGPCYNRRRVD